MKISLTGASGFLGRFFLQQLLSSRHEIKAWWRGDLADAPELANVSWIHGQLDNPHATTELVRDADAVIHSAVFRGGDSFMSPTADPVEYWQTNVTGSLRLLEAAHQSGVGQFIFISSGAVHDRVLEDRPLDETHPLRPSTLYGSYKASVETLVHHYGTAGKLWTANLRPTSIYGIADPIEHSKWFDLVQKIKRGKDVHVTGGSKTVHAGDVVKAVQLLLSQKAQPAGETFNCCDRMISEFEVAEIAQRLTGSGSAITGIRKTAKHQINTDKLQSLGLQFGSDALLESTIESMLEQA